MWAEWTTAQVALVISGCSFVIASASFIWNVWSKFIYPKPKLEVSLGRFVTVAKEEKDQHSMVLLSAVNHGPSDTTIKLIVGRIPRWHSFLTRKFKPLLIKHWGAVKDTHALPPIELPASIEVGQEVKFYFPDSITWFEKEKHIQIGLVDIFGRSHWARRRNMQKLKRDLESLEER